MVALIVVWCASICSFTLDTRGSIYRQPATAPEYLETLVGDVLGGGDTVLESNSETLPKHYTARQHNSYSDVMSKVIAMSSSISRAVPWKGFPRFSTG